MNNIKNKIKLAAAVATMGLGISSCSLDMLPLNDVVLENYWTDKSDVESVVTSCYVGMQENGYVSQMIVWGEARSENIVAGPNVPSALSNLMKGSLKTTNTYCNWSSMYNVINRCNTVLYYAPMVAEEDPNYTESDLRINMAECKALRAMSYLTLIKTFKDVPFTLQPSIDDNIDYRLGQTKFEVILDSLIADIDGCKDDAPRRYSTKAYNTGKITRVAMYALLAELYLWRASDSNLTVAQQNEYYRKCVEACDWVINYKVEEYKLNADIDGEDYTKIVDEEVWSTYGYPLLSETKTDKNLNNAFNSIFGKGNSFESIFEITYAPIGGFASKTNTDVGYMYGGYDSNNSSVQYLKANEDLLTSAPTGTTFTNTALFPVATDFRTLEPFQYTENGSFDILKYSNSSVSVSYSGSGTATYTSATLANSNARMYDMMYSNWIMYRLTEIMLFRAEAEIEMAGNLNKSAASEEKSDTTTTASAKQHKASVATNGASLSTAEELYDDAFNLISAIYVRSNPATKTAESAKPKRTDFKELSDFETLLMNERHRELLFEGKRYFDLVRVSRREGNTNKFVQTLTSKFGDGGSAVAIKMRQMDFMYMPILKTQIQVNPNLKQNSAYLDEETIVKN